MINGIFIDILSYTFSYVIFHFIFFNTIDVISLSLFFLPGFLGILHCISVLKISDLEKINCCLNCMLLSCSVSLASFYNGSSKSLSAICLFVPLHFCNDS